MYFATFISEILKVKDKKLPGSISHNKLMDLQVRDQLFKNVIADTPPKKSAVLALFYPNKQGKTKLVFILRKSYNGHHSGQIAFPGGKVEKVDANLQETALRETWEEIGVPPQTIQVVTDLTPVFIPVSNYMVYPFLGYTETTPNFVKDPVEVEEILEFSFKDIKVRNMLTIPKIYFNKTYDIQCFQINKYKIWGATAMILSEIVDLLE